MPLERAIYDKSAIAAEISELLLVHIIGSEWVLFGNQRPREATRLLPHLNPWHPLSAAATQKIQEFLPPKINTSGTEASGLWDSSGVGRGADAQILFKSPRSLLAPSGNHIAKWVLPQASGHLL